MFVNAWIKYKLINKYLLRSNGCVIRIHALKRGFVTETIISGSLNLYYFTVIGCLWYV